MGIELPILVVSFPAFPRAVLECCLLDIPWILLELDDFCLPVTFRRGLDRLAPLTGPAEEIPLGFDYAR